MKIRPAVGMAHTLTAQSSEATFWNICCDLSSSAS